MLHDLFLKIGEFLTRTGTIVLVDSYTKSTYIVHILIYSSSRGQLSMHSWVGNLRPVIMIPRSIKVKNHLSRVSVPLIL
jgi:hypothetical protein